MLRILENGADLVVYLLIQDRNFFHYMPWAGVMDQKLRLLAFLDHGITKVSLNTSAESFCTGSSRSMSAGAF